MNHPIIKKAAPYLVAVIVFLVVVFAYFSPMLEGKQVRQGDNIQFRGMSKEIVDHREEFQEEALWSNNMFGGMPAYLTSVRYPSNLLKHVDRIFSLFLQTPAKYIFFTMLGFYLLLVVGFRTDPWLSIAGALAFAFSSYFFIIIGAGHNSKSHAIAYMAPVLLGIILTYQGKYLWGGILTSLFLGLQISAGHPQITYYTLFIVLIFGILWLVEVLKNKSYLAFARSMLVLVLAVVLAVGSNITFMLLTLEWGKDSIRGPSELSSDSQNRTSGLDKDYILNDYSYGIDESLNLLIPNFKGGASRGFDLDSKTYEEFRRNNVPNARQLVEGLPLAYWGGQRGTSGPVYIGASIILLFVLGLFLIKDNRKWWLVSVVFLALILAWGKNLMFVSEFFINYVPGYNKFRTVSMILVMAELAIPLLGILAVAEVLKDNTPVPEATRYLKYSVYIVGGITLFFSLFPGMLLNFSGGIDEQLTSSGWPTQFIAAIQEDRKDLLRQDAFRSLLLVLATSGLLLAYLYKKLKPEYFILLLAVIFLVDLWPVNKRYLNNDDFTNKQEIKEPFQPTPADLAILSDNDPNFRVFNLTVDAFNEARTAYFHKSIGGYHGAKLRRYQELISEHIAQNNQAVLNMLNTKYFIVASPEGQAMVQQNPGALGNAWFVDEYRVVANADEEIAALKDFQPEKEAIVDQRFIDQLNGFKPESDSLATIELISYLPNELRYKSSGSQPQLAVFSEIYYDKGWRAYIDDKEVPHFRANYVLRAMIVPEGEHEIRFEFKPRSYFVGEKIALFSSMTIILLFVGAGASTLRKSVSGKKDPRETDQAQEE